MENSNEMWRFNGVCNLSFYGGIAISLKSNSREEPMVRTCCLSIRRRVAVENSKTGLPAAKTVKWERAIDTRPQRYPNHDIVFEALNNRRSIARYVNARILILNANGQLDIQGTDYSAVHASILCNTFRDFKKKLHVKKISANIIGDVK